jgi:hypothetical protein
MPGIRNYNMVPLKIVLAIGLVLVLMGIWKVVDLVAVAWP